MRGWRRLGAALTLAVPLWLVGVATAAALERPGGGSSFSGGGGGFSGGGGSSWSGGGGGFSGGGGDGGLVGAVIGLALVVIIQIVKHANGVSDGDSWSSGGYSGSDYTPVISPPTPAKPAPVRMAKLRKHDPHFSRILLEDFLYELYTRAQEARGSEDDLGHLAPYFSPKMRDKLLNRGRRRVLAVTGVIVGAMRITSYREVEGWAQITVRYETNFTEIYPSEQGQGQLGFYSVERWTFTRRLTAQSSEPGQTRSWGCPSCGAPVEDSQYDACAHCGATHGTGEFDWLCNGIRVRREETRGPALTTYAPEVGTFDPTVRDPRLDRRLRALKEHDPEFDLESFYARFGMIYHELNAAWSSLDWDDAKPYLSDRMWMSMRYWIHAYEEQSLQNLMLGAKVTRRELAKIDVDPYFHSITVRFWASALDHTIHRGTGSVVCGSATRPRDYSEYWTFIRSAKRKGKASADKNCPSCGAGLKINMAGNCEYCGVKVTQGEFDWVLSKIEQDEAYLG